MATPTSGTISMLNMRSEITRGTGAISMSEVRTRYGGSGAISFNQLYACEGWIQTNGQTVTKFVTINGWNYLSGPTGSVAPNDTGDNRVIVVSAAPGSRLEGNFNAGGNNVLDIGNNSAGSTLSSGFTGTDVIRIVLANTNQTGTITSQTTTSVQYSGGTIGTSGTQHCLVQF